MPLCRRPAAFEEEMHAVLTWKAQMAGQISLLGDAWEREDGGPDHQGLLVGGWVHVQAWHVSLEHASGFGLVGRLCCGLLLHMTEGRTTRG